MMNPQETETLFRQCTRFLAGHYPQRPQQVLAELAAWTDPDVVGDRYGQGSLINDFEAEVAGLLGKEAAVFMPSGTMAQQIAMRIWAERKGSPSIGFHPTAHLEIHEEQGYRLLHGLQGVLIGSAERLITLKDLERVTDPLGALLLELPQREIGGQLPTWDELTAIVDWARVRQIPVHMDGARLWECQPFYQREYAAIAALFDSVYVSFYKGIGGLAGSILAGPRDFIASARRWLRRHGGNLVQLYPYVLSAKKGMQERLPRMGAYHAKALEIAAALTGQPRIELRPNPPHTHMMHLFLKGDEGTMEANIIQAMRETGVWLPPQFRGNPIPGYHKIELTVGDATLDLTTPEIVDLFHRILG